MKRVVQAVLHCAGETCLCPVTLSAARYLVLSVQEQQGPPNTRSPDPGNTRRTVIYSSGVPHEPGPCCTHQVCSDGALCQHEGAFRYQEYLDI